MNNIVVSNNISQHFFGFANNSNRFRNFIYNVLDMVCPINFAAIIIPKNIVNSTWDTFTVSMKIVKCLTGLILFSSIEDRPY